MPLGDSLRNKLAQKAHQYLGPPQAGYPPNSMSGYPNQGGQGYGQPPYGAPQGQFPPQPYQQYPPQAPPPGHSPYPQQAPFGPPSHSPSFPQAPLQGYPPHQQPFQQPVPHSSPQQFGQYGQPQVPLGVPPQQFGPPSIASPGYVYGQVPPTDMTGPAMQLREAMKGFGTNERLLISTLVQVPDPQHMSKLRQTFDQRFRRDLIKDITSETSGYLKEGLCAIARGPLAQDAYNVEKAVRGAGTKERLLDEVCLGRSNADMIAIKQEYQRTYRKDMVKEIRDDLSMKTERLYEYVLAAQRAEESAPCIPHEIEQKVDRLQQATRGMKVGTNQDVVSQILAYSSDGQIRAISLKYKEKYRESLRDVLKSNFSGHMGHALLLMHDRAVDRVKADADGLEASMKGLGTKDEMLVNQIVRIHWNKEHLRQVKIAYSHFHKRKLADRVAGETSGHYKELMVALIGP